jgi:hypothetical protein
MLKKPYYVYHGKFNPLPRPPQTMTDRTNNRQQPSQTVTNTDMSVTVCNAEELFFVGFVTVCGKVVGRRGQLFHDILQHSFPIVFHKMERTLLTNKVLLKS